MSSDSPPAAKRPKLDENDENEDKRDENDKLADMLEAEYGGDKPQDLHIDYFYLILADSVTEEQRQKLQKYLEEDKVGKWETINSTQWPQFLVGKYEVPGKTEREREYKLYSQIESTGYMIEGEFIVSRVCKYTTMVFKRPIVPIDVMKIGKLLSTHYNAEVENNHLDHFYLVVGLAEARKPTSFKDVEAYLSATLPTMPGEWKQVKSPPETPWAWSLTYFGFFPKASPEETERAREWRLHTEVRLPLKVKLKMSGLTEKAHILFTRACIHNEKESTNDC